MNDIVLECRDLGKVYRQGDLDVSVMSGVDFQLARGEQVAIVGESGTGKSTLLHLLAGLDLPTAGTVTLDGIDISSLNDTERGRVRNTTLGFVYQFHHLLPEFTALENVALPLLVRRMSSDEAKNQAMTILDRVGLHARVSHKPGELSGGERQRVAIARALVIKPVCLLADEPTGNVDRRNADTIQELMVELDRDLKVSLLVATHDPHLASSMDRILRIEDGNLVRA